jgi:hypothetical protein
MQNIICPLKDSNTISTKTHTIFSQNNAEVNKMTHL